MSDPTIRISSCCQDGRCPECGEGSAFPFRLLCGCSPCLSSACSLNHTRALLTEALRQRDDYSDRAKASMLIAESRTGPEHDCFFREERAAAIREHQRALGEAAEISQGLQSRLDEVTRERDEARATIARQALRIQQQETAWSASQSATLPTLERITNLEREVSRLHHILQEANARLAPEDPVNVEIGEVLQSCAKSKEMADRAEALLAEARTEHRDISERYIAASSARIRAEALLRDARPKLSSYRMMLLLQPHTGPLCADIEALLAKIREVVG